jgi:LacI family transcriptional regulator, galactose operon repressor
MSTMRQVAERAGVSAKTVSRVMNNDRYVSDEVRARVERAIEELHYVPNLLARTFRSGRDAAIGVAVPDISDPFFAAVTHAIEQIARTRGTAVFVTSLGTDGDHEQAGVEALLSRQVVGLISTPVAADQSYLKPWQARTAMVFIDRPPSKITADIVLEDDHGGAHTATTHLTSQGHRRIAFLGDQLSIVTTARRLDGYRSALRDAGIDEDPDLVAFNVTSTAEAAETIAKLLASVDAPTAIFSSNTKSSLSIVLALQAIERTDVALVSFGDVPLAAALRPALTVVDQNPDALGTFAATRLFDRLDNPQRRMRRNTILPVNLIIR